MFRPENAMTGNIHHAVAHGSAYKYADRGDDKYSLERSGLGTYGRIEEIYRVIAYSNRKIEYCQQEKENDDA